MIEVPSVEDVSAGVVWVGVGIAVSGVLPCDIDTVSEQLCPQV